MDADPSSRAPRREPRAGAVRRRGFRRPAAVLLLAALLLLAAAPTLVAHTPLRHWLLNRALAPTELQGSVRDVQCGWFSPLVLGRLEVRHPEQRVQLRARELRFERSWCGLWRQAPDLGHIRVDAPHLRLVLPDAPPFFPRRSGRRADTTLATTMLDSTIELQIEGDSSPLITVDEVDLRLRVERLEDGRFLHLEPVRLLDNAPLTPALFRQGLQLIAPLLAESTQLQGKGSLEFTRFRVPLDVPPGGSAAPRAEVQGILKVERLSAGLRDATLQEMSALVTRLVQVDMPRSIRVLDNTEIAFELREGRVHHEGLSFVLPELSPEVAWKTRGSVGLDETLDLIVQVELPDRLIGRLPPLLRRISRRPLEFRVTGTLDAPRWRPSTGGQWLLDLADDLLGGAGER